MTTICTSHWIKVCFVSMYQQRPWDAPWWRRYRPTFLRCPWLNIFRTVGSEVVRTRDHGSKLSEFTVTIVSPVILRDCVTPVHKVSFFAISGVHSHITQRKEVKTVKMVTLSLVMEILDLLHSMCFYGICHCKRRYLIRYVCCNVSCSVWM